MCIGSGRLCLNRVCLCVGTWLRWRAMLNPAVCRVSSVSLSSSGGGGAQVARMHGSELTLVTNLLVEKAAFCRRPHFGSGIFDVLRRCRCGFQCRAGRPPASAKLGNCWTSRCFWRLQVSQLAHSMAQPQSLVGAITTSGSPASPVSTALRAHDPPETAPAATAASSRVTLDRASLLPPESLPGSTSTSVPSPGALRSQRALWIASLPNPPALRRVYSCRGPLTTARLVPTPGARAHTEGSDDAHDPWKLCSSLTPPSVLSHGAFRLFTATATLSPSDFAPCPHAGFLANQL